MKWLSAFAKGLSVSAVLAGCATGSSMRDMPRNLPPIAAEMGRVWFYRPSSPSANFLRPAIHLNGRVIGTSRPGSVFFRDLVPGDYTVSIVTEVDRQLTFTLAARQERFVRTALGFGIAVARIHPELIETTEARAEMADLSYADAN